MKQASDKAADELNKRFNIERRERDAQRKDQAIYYNEEHKKLEDSLKARELTVSEYYREEIGLIGENLQKEKDIINKEYETEQDLLVKLYNERGELLKTPNLSEEDKQKIILEMEDLYAQLVQSVAEYNLVMQQIEYEATEKMQELHLRAIDEEMNALRDATDEMASVMDSIISSGDGLSSHWTSAFETMANGIINLTQKVREGGDAWQDYAQLAVAAF
jgi:hypothetical protein